jgi:hypothetical protein
MKSIVRAERLKVRVKNGAGFISVAGDGGTHADNARAASQ